jgi:hypothetical protein
MFPYRISTCADRHFSPPNRYFVAYELVKDALKPANSDQLSVPAVITAGAAAGVAMWSIALPADTVKSKLQSASEGTYKGVVDCVRKTWGESGWRGFYHGFGPAMARAVPANVSSKYDERRGGWRKGAGEWKCNGCDRGEALGVPLGARVELGTDDYTVCQCNTRVTSYRKARKGMSGSTSRRNAGSANRRTHAERQKKTRDGVTNPS